MRTELVPAPWNRRKPSALLAEAMEIVGSDVWAEAAVAFHEERQAKRKAGQQAPKGAQREINMALRKRFLAKGWSWDGGRCLKDRTLVRITFRHQMSLESDLYEALKMCKDDRVDEAAILAADQRFLELITPNDAATLCSFEKFEQEVNSSRALEGVPLFLGRLTPKSEPPGEVSDALRFLPRFRDKGIPIN